MEIEKKFTFDEAEALARLKALGEYLDNKHGIKVTWENDRRAVFSGKYMVVKIEGELALAPGVARFKGKDPGFLWRKRATEYIEEKLATYLDPKNPIDKLPRGA